LSFSFFKTIGYVRPSSLASALLNILIQQDDHDLLFIGTSMELMKNKVSGRLFILLEDIDHSSLLLITPEGKVKRLARHLFTPQDSDNHSDVPMVHQLTKRQIEMYERYSEKQTLRS
jgi:hypothetical protein